MTEDDELARRVCDFWFGREGSEIDGEVRAEWFRKDATFDETIRSAFLEPVQAAIDGDPDIIGEDCAPDCLALIILLDQFPRNLFRGDARSFAGDERALVTAKRAIARGFDGQVPLVQRTFFYLPYEHSESMVDQERCIELFQLAGNEEMVKYAIAHRDIIARFGRFPHRNEVLGRSSTAAELEFLEGPNSSF